jgi:hypothetical protein
MNYKYQQKKYRLKLRIVIYRPIEIQYYRFDHLSNCSGCRQHKYHRQQAEGGARRGIIRVAVFPSKLDVAFVRTIVWQLDGSENLKIAFCLRRGIH